LTSPNLSIEFGQTGQLIRIATRLARKQRSP
jgi:hypothetical protein